MPKRFNNPRVWRVSSQAIKSTSRNTRNAREVRSSRLPIGVATMKSVPGMFVALSHREWRKTKAPRAFESGGALSDEGSSNGSGHDCPLITHPQIVPLGDYVHTPTYLPE